MKESSLSRKIKRELEGRGCRWVRVENQVGVGTPDVWVSCPSGVRGWLELKAWHHLTPEQKVWLVEERKVGGGSWVLVDRGEPRLFDGAAAINLDKHEPLAVGLKEIGNYFAGGGDEG